MARFSCNVISYTLKRTVDMVVVVPTPTIPDAMGMDGRQACHTPKAKYPVLYLLHGYGNNEGQWTGYTNVELFAEERQIAVVMIAAENKFYINQPGGDSYADFIDKELPEFICGMFPVSERPEDTYIAGLSMGGFGALCHSLNHPVRFAAAGAFSAAISANPVQSDITSTEERELLPEHDLFQIAQKAAAAGRLPKLYVSCGDKDFLLEANQKFVDHLKRLDADVTWTVTPGFGHEWRFWNQEVERFLDWVPRTDAFAGEKRQV